MGEREWYEKECPRCGKDKKIRQVSCPDGKSGCAVWHGEYYCDCKGERMTREQLTKLINKSWRMNVNLSDHINYSLKIAEEMGLIEKDEIELAIDYMRSHSIEHGNDARGIEQKTIVYDKVLAERVIALQRQRIKELEEAK